MPRYYLRIEPQGIIDEDGEELPGVEAAKRLADRVADDLTKNRDPDQPYQLVVVTDESGQVVHEKPLVLH
jgi:hypothetical protein